MQGRREEHPAGRVAGFPAGTALAVSDDEIAAALGGRLRAFLRPCGKARLIRDGVVAGRFPRRALGHVIEWYAAHKPELEENWQLARDRQPLKPIEPLE